MSQIKQNRNNKTIIYLGSKYNLHTGYHDPLIEYSGKNLSYIVKNPKIMCFLLNGKGARFNPAKDPLYIEVHKYDKKAKYIQSAFFPVYNKVPWIVDMDDICLPIFGNACINKNAMRKLYDQYFKDPIYKKTILARIRWYSSPFCKGILFWSIAGIRSAIACFKYFDIYNTPEAKTFLGKIALAYPALKPMIMKPRLNTPPAILFMGRDFENKGGPIALATFKILYDHDPQLNLIYCGPIPGGYKRRYSNMLERILYFPSLNHKQSLFLFRKSDIYLFPTQFESLGITLIEAKAAGCVPVTYCGDGLPAMEEIIENHKNGILLKKPKLPANIEKEALKYSRQIMHLLSNKVLLLKMKQKGLREVVSGKHSFPVWTKMLNKMLNSEMGRSQQIKDPNRYKLCSYGGDEFQKKILAYRKKKRIQRRNII